MTRRSESSEGEVSSDSQELSGRQLPDVEAEVPGPRAVELIDDLSRTECPAITARRARREEETGASEDPVVWERARGANVEDVDGNVYVDLTAAFAVAGLGHNPPAVREAAHRQLESLTHAMGDVYPSRVKIEFCNRLAEVAPGELQQSILGLSGSDAVQAALKTAAVHTGQPGVIAFWGGYHGLAYGALSATAYKEAFRRPFLGQLNQHVRHVPYPNVARPPFGLERGVEADRLRDACLSHLRSMLRDEATGAEGIGAILAEPLQGRGGIVTPPEGFLEGLREICDEFGLVLIFDEIFTGLGRTGDLFACQREGVVPDVLCLGKAMGGGFPLSATIGHPEVMRSWEVSTGEAIHTQTFLGNPLGCAMADAAVAEIVDEEWPARVRRREPQIRRDLEELADRHPSTVGAIRGRGMMWGIELVCGEQQRPHPRLARKLMDFCRQHGYLIVPSGVRGNVLSLTPPFVLTDEQWAAFVTILDEGLRRLTDGA